MEEKRIENIVKGVLFASRGRVAIQHELTMPFIDDVAESFRKSGFIDAIDEPMYPPGFESKREQPTAFGTVPLLIGFSIFLGTSIGSWIVKKLCDEVYETKIQPHFNKFISKHKEKFGYVKQIEVNFDVYYETDDLHVHIRANARSSEELKNIATLIPVAERASLAWVDKHRITHKTMIYYIKNGELTNNPELEDNVL